MAYISEISYTGAIEADFVAVAVPAGTDTSGWIVQTYNNGGNVQNTAGFGTPVSSNDGKDLYVFEGSGPIGQLISNTSVALVDDTGTVVQFVSFEGNTVTAKKGAADDLTSTDIGTAQPDESLQTFDEGATYVSGPPTSGTAPCFGPGTRILTPSGWRPVEEIKAGDLIHTVDHGPQPVIWTQSSKQTIMHADGRWPILIEAEAFGPGAPFDDLILSGQHRILVGTETVLPIVFAQEYLAPAKAFAFSPGIRQLRACRQITWYHFALRKHAVCIADGLAVESLYLGPMVLQGLPVWERQMLHALFGELDATGALNGPKARPFLKVGQVRRVLTAAAAA